jgi:hypothetical protein
MADRLKDLSESEQRIEIMRRNGEDFRDEDGNWLVPLGSGFASGVVRAIWGDDPDDDGGDGTHGDGHSHRTPIGSAA